jgi:hypothetical protein
MTTQATHTQKRWAAAIDRDKYDSRLDDIRVVEAGSAAHPQGALTIARINQHLGDESAANARLIASAPALLAALETIAAGNTDPERMVEIAREVIARTEGEQ